MARSLSTILVAAVLLGSAGGARADWDDQPGFGFTGDFLVSLPDSPCGVGTPPRGHFPPEIPAIGPFQAVTLTVRQDPQRLCYVFGKVAEAPVIRVRQGEDLLITLKNEITDPEALDKVVPIAHLNEPNPPVSAKPGFYPVVPAMHHKATGATNLHLHGFAVPPTVPQDEVLKTCVDPAVGPAECGRRQFTYHYRIASTMPAGLYWYHPHVHGEVQAQMLMGLSGALVVEGPADDARRAAGIVDRIFIVRQSQDLDEKTPTPPGSAMPESAAPEAVAPEAVAPGAVRPKSLPEKGERIDTADEVACSSKGGINELTLNGSKVLDGPAEDADLAHIEIAAGKKQLWRVLNAATDAFLNLALVDEEGKPHPIAIAARDGVPLSSDAGGLLPPMTTVEPQLVPPAGRLEFYVDAPQAGHKTYLVSHAVDTGCAGDKVPERRLAYLTPVETGQAPAGSPAAIQSAAIPSAPAAADPVPGPFSGLLARNTDRERVIAFAEYPHPGADDLNDFYIFEKRPGAVLRPFEMNGPPAITVASGTTEEWVIENWTNELHAFHIHQLHFRVLEVDGKRQADPELLDIVTVPSAQPADVTAAPDAVSPGRVRIKLYFPPELAGDIPFHCHLVDHEDSGMMAVLRVLPPQTSVQIRADASLPDILANPPMCRSGNSATVPVPAASPVSAHRAAASRS